jgi:hypothetical protein
VLSSQPKHPCYGDGAGDIAAIALVDPESPRGHDLLLRLRADAHPRSAPCPEPQACEPRQGEDTHRDPQPGQIAVRREQDREQ